METADHRQIVAHENIDSRREIHLLLNRLSPAKRIAFARWCCRQARLPNSNVYPKVSPKTTKLAEQARWDTRANERLSLEIFWDIWLLCTSYKFNLDLALAKLVEMVS